MPRRLLATRHASIVEPDANRPERRRVKTPGPVEDGIETHAIDGTPVCVFNVPRAIAVCLRYWRTAGGAAPT